MNEDDVINTLGATRLFYRWGKIFIDLTPSPVHRDRWSKDGDEPLLREYRHQGPNFWLHKLREHCIAMEPMTMSSSELRGAVHGTILYLCVYASLLTFQSMSKYYLIAQKKKKGEKVSFRSLKYYNRDDPLALAGDRAVGNFHEQSVLFLPLFWMHAMLCSPSQSWAIALVYSLTRGSYPILFLSKSKFTVLLSTIPGYLILVFLMAQVLRSV